MSPSSTATDKKNPGFLTETCLLTFGLASFTEAGIEAGWEAAGAGGAQLCWVEEGEIVIGGVREYLRFRASSPKGKFSSFSLDRAIREKLTGALTASATMEACRRFGIPYAVSCGIGGIGDVKGEELCPDLPAARDLPVVLICTSPKDMLDIEATVGWLREAGVKVLGDGCRVCTGYVFDGAPVQLSGSWDGGPVPPHSVILRGIAPEKRIKDKAMLAAAVAEGKAAELRGGYYHPAVNAALDRLSDGYSSKIQFESLLDNIVFARRLSGLTA